MLPNILRPLNRCRLAHLLVVCVSASAGATGIHAQAIDLSTRIPAAETDFDVGFLPLDVVPDGPWRKDDLQEPTHFRWTWMNGLLSTTQFRWTEPDLGRPAEEFEWIRSLWTGDSWYSVSAPEHSYVIEKSPKLNPTTDFLAAFNMVDWTVFAAEGGLRQVLRESRVLSEHDEAGVSRVRVARNEQASLQLEVAFDRNQGRLSEIIGEVFTSDPDLTRRMLVARVSFRIVEWTAVDGKDVPLRAVRESTTFRNDMTNATPEKPTSQRIGIIRRSLRTLEADKIDPATFTPPQPEPSMAVADTRQRISYRIGKDIMLVDGSLFRLAEPIDHIVQPGELEALLSHATPAR